MKILVTAGSTRVMIDQVRCITNIFHGKTGHAIANCFADKGHKVTLLSNATYGIEPYVLSYQFKTYDELYRMMEEELAVPRYDVVIHSAAVSDYYVEGTYNAALEKLDSSEKICSDHEELYLKLTPTPKIIDQIRDVWGFKGTLVKFKLQVGMSDEELIGIAEASRIHSKADLIVANCLEWCRERAIIIGEDGLVLETTREALPRMLYQIIVGDPTC